MLVFAAVLATILPSVAAEVCASGETCMASPDLTDTTTKKMAAAQFLSYAAYGYEEAGLYQKISPICGRAAADAYPPQKNYPFEFKLKEDLEQGQLKEYSAITLARMEIRYSWFRLSMCDVSNAIITIPKFNGEPFKDSDDRPICAVAFRGSQAEKEFLADIGKGRGWIVFGDSWDQKLDITIVNKGTSEEYGNTKYLRVANQIYDRFKEFVDINSKEKDYRYGRKATSMPADMGLDTTPPDDAVDLEPTDGLQSILLEYMKNTDAGKPRCSQKEVWVTGHSLGGAFATFFSLGLKYGMMRPEHAEDNIVNSGFQRDVISAQQVRGKMANMKYQTMHSLAHGLSTEGPKVKSVTNNGMPIFARDPKFKAYICPPKDWGAGLYRTVSTNWALQLYDGLGSITNIAAFLGLFRPSQMYYCSEAYSMDFDTLGTDSERGGLPPSQELVKQGMGFPFDPRKGDRGSESKVHKQESVACKYGKEAGKREWKGTPDFRKWVSLKSLHDSKVPPTIWAKKASENLQLADIQEPNLEAWCSTTRQQSSGTESDLSQPEYSEAIVHAALRDQSKYPILLMMVSFLAGLMVAKTCTCKSKENINFQFALLENEI